MFDCLLVHNSKDGIFGEVIPRTNVKFTLVTRLNADLPPSVNITHKGVRT